MESRIHAADRVLLLRMEPTSEHAIEASVYVLEGDRHEWVVIQEPLSIAGAAALFGDLHDLDGGVRLEVGGDVNKPWRNDLLRELERELFKRGLTVSEALHP